MKSFPVQYYEGPAEAWDELVAAHGTPTQGWRYGQLLAEGMGQRVVRLAARDGAQLAGGITLVLNRHPLFGKFASSLPVADHSGPVLATPEALGALVQATTQLLAEEGLEFAQWRCDHELALEAPARGDKITLRLALPADPEELWGELKAKVRNLVRKGEKAELSYRQGGAELLDGFWEVYTRNLRDLGTPCYPRGLFERWLALYGQDARVHLALTPEGQVAAGGFTWRAGDRQCIPFAASRRELRSISPNMFLYWEMLRASIGAGATEFDFGRSSEGGGTHRFKKQWGAREVPLHWYHVGAGEAAAPSPDDGAFALASRVWQRLPVGLATALGTRISRHLP